MKQSLWMKISLLAVLLLMFLGYSTYHAYRTTHFKVDKNAFLSIPSYTDFMKGSYPNIPGLGVADYFHLITAVKKTVPLTELQKDLQLHAVWVTQHSLYLVYSVNINPTDKGLNNVPTLHFSLVTYQFSDGKTLTLHVKQPNSVRTGDSHAIGHRVYRTLYYIPSYPSLSPNHYEQIVQHELRKLSKITILDPTVESGYMGQRFKMKALTIPASYTNASSVLKTYKVNKTLVLTNGTNVTINNISIKSLNTVIGLSLKEPKQDDVQEILFSIKGEKEDYGLMGASFDGTSQHILMQPIKKLPTTLTIQPVKIMYTPKVLYHFTITRKELMNAPQEQTALGHIDHKTVFFNVVPLNVGNKKQHTSLLTLWLSPDPEATIRFSTNNSLAQDQFSSVVTLRYNHEKPMQQLKLYQFDLAQNKEEWSYLIKTQELSSAQSIEVSIKPIFYIKGVENATKVQIKMN